MIGPVLRVAWYRFRATLGHRWSGYLSVALLVGLVGGVAMGSIAAARRTQSSFSVFLASTNPSDLSMPTFGAGAVNSASPNYSATLTKEIADLPGVRHAEAWINVNGAPMDAHGGPRLGAINEIQPVASVDGLFFDQDRLAVTAGRMADPSRPDEVVMTPAARLLGFHVGQVIPYGIYTPADSCRASAPRASRPTVASTPGWSGWSR